MVSPKQRIGGFRKFSSVAAYSSFNKFRMSGMVAGGLFAVLPAYAYRHSRRSVTVIPA